MPKSKLKKISKSKIQIIKLRNRRGYAAICLNNLTEGLTPAQAISRLKNPLKRMGLELA
jgi:hypothetical protein